MDLKVVCVGQRFNIVVPVILMLPTGVSVVRHDDTDEIAGLAIGLRKVYCSCEMFRTEFRTEKHEAFLRERRSIVCEITVQD